jgi:DNA modification methylase
MQLTNIKCLNQEHGDRYSLYHGDSCEIIQAIPDDSIGLSVYSPPFSSLYTYTPSIRDIGNCRGDEEFYNHFGFLAGELFRVMMPGRIMAVHCMQIPALKERDGYIGLKDFRGDLIRLFQKVGFIYHSEVLIKKDPIVQMQRTKALGLLHKQLVKDSAMSRQALPDYLVVFRKPGDNPEPIAGELTHYYGTNPPPKYSDKTKQSINIWQRYADEVWFDIDPSNTLNYQEARDTDDGRHIAPLQLMVIRRAVQLWSNPDDIVFTPFMGIGSECYVAAEKGRKAIGIELKDSYFEVACKNLKAIANKPKQYSLFEG